MVRFSCAASLARKGVNYETPYIEKLMQEVHGSYDPGFWYSAHCIKSFQESMLLNDERSLFDWASKQNVYIQMTNMMNAAVLMGMIHVQSKDSIKKVEALFRRKGVLGYIRILSFYVCFWL